MKLSKIRTNQRVVGALALGLVLGVPLTVYAGKVRHRARGGSEVVTECRIALKRSGIADNPKAMIGCITGICDSLHDKRKESAKFNACMANANRKLKE